MIKYNNTILGISDNIQFVKVSGKNKRAKYVIYDSNRAYPINGLYGEIFERITHFDTFDLSNIPRLQKSLKKCFSFFYDLNWIKEISGNDNVKLTLSYYTYYTEIDGKFFIVNFLYKTVDLLSKDTYLLIINKEYEKIPSNDLFYLFTRKYLKEEKVNDEIHYFENQIEYKAVYIILSYDCNLKCKYCFESKLNRNYQMTNEVFDSSVKFIDSLSITNNTIINFYGGEPLLEKNKERINKIFKQFRSNNQVYYQFVTNGVNIKKYIDYFEPVKSKILDFVITIDGTKEVHDKRRITNDSKGSFDAIISSIDTLNKYDYPVSIRINIDEDNYDCQEELINFLNKRINKKSRVKIEYHRVEDKTNIDYRPTTYLDCFKLYKRIKKISRFKITFNLPIIGLLNDISENTYSTPQVIKTNCTQEANHVIDYDGQIYSCHEAMGNEAFKIGTVEQGTDTSCKLVSNKNCDSCAFYLGCYGGCILENHYYMEQTKQKKCNYNQIMDTVNYFLHNESGIKKFRI